ncbi:MAG: HEAT repeat domain-containing protein [Pyrinomonadaceae bacterium]|nr:HEAT repeat domain-containing protein [Pyrinomonadaceae bacterium]
MSKKSHQSKRNLEIPIYPCLIIISLLFVFNGCSINFVLNVNNNEKIDQNTSKEIDLLISQFDSPSEGDSVLELIKIAKTSQASRNEVVSNLIKRFDSYQKNNKLKIPNGYLRLFQELNAVEALDVLVKYINIQKAFSDHEIDSITAEIIEKFGEESIPSLEKGLKNPDWQIRMISAITLCRLNFKQEEIGKKRAIEVLKNAEESESNRNVISAIDQALITLTKPN